MSSTNRASTMNSIRQLYATAWTGGGQIVYATRMRGIGSALLSKESGMGVVMYLLALSTSLHYKDVQPPAD
jgi:hypothetical protein